jgi:hypothetical protein
MSQHYILIKNINLNLFNASIYKFDDYVGEVVDETTINNNLIELNNQETAIEVAQLLSEFSGVSKIDIFNKSNNLLFSLESSL